MKYTFFLLSLLISQYAFAQEEVVTYTTIADIYYHNGDLDDYAKERCVLDLYYPTNVSDFPTIVWFHGGGLKAGNKFIPEDFKEQGLAVIAVNYRFSPQVTAPTYIEDAAAAVAWSFQHIAEYGGNPELIFVAGHSAGGYLSSMVGLDSTYLQPYGIHPNQIAGLIPYSGHAITHFTIRNERGIPPNKPLIDEYAPISFCRADAPPYILITADREQELFGRYEEVAYQARMMKLSGHEKTELHEMSGYSHGNLRDAANHILLRTVERLVKEYNEGQ